MVAVRLSLLSISLVATLLSTSTLAVPLPAIEDGPPVDSVDAIIKSGEQVCFERQSDCKQLETIVRYSLMIYAHTKAPKSKAQKLKDDLSDQLHSLKPSKPIGKSTHSSTTPAPVVTLEAIRKHRLEPTWDVELRRLDRSFWNYLSDVVTSLAQLLVEASNIEALYKAYREAWEGSLSDVSHDIANLVFGVDRVNRERAQRDWRDGHGPDEGSAPNRKEEPISSPIFAPVPDNNSTNLNQNEQAPKTNGKERQFFGDGRNNRPAESLDPEEIVVEPPSATIQPSQSQNSEQGQNKTSVDKSMTTTTSLPDSRPGKKFFPEQENSKEVEPDEVKVD